MFSDVAHAKNFFATSEEEMHAVRKEILNTGEYHSKAIWFVDTDELVRADQIWVFLTQNEVTKNCGLNEFGNGP